MSEHTSWPELKKRIDTLVRVATALDRHLVLSFPVTVPENLTDAVQVA